MEVENTPNGRKFVEVEVENRQKFAERKLNTMYDKSINVRKKQIEGLETKQSSQIIFNFKTTFVIINTETIDENTFLESIFFGFPPIFIAFV